MKAIITKEGDKFTFSYEIPSFDYTSEMIEKYKKELSFSDEQAFSTILTGIASELAIMLLEYQRDIGRGKVKVSIPE